MPLSRELVQAVRKHVAEEPHVNLGHLARMLGAKETDVVTALPVAMRKKARREDFGAIWNELGGCRMLVAASPRSEREERIEGRPVVDGLGKAALLPEGKTAVPLVDPAEVASVWFVTRPGHAGLLQLYGEQGTLLVALTVSPEASDPERALFATLPEKYGVTPVPRMHCKGGGKPCGQCQCAHKGLH